LALRNFPTKTFPQNVSSKLLRRKKALSFAPFRAHQNCQYLQEEDFFLWGASILGRGTGRFFPVCQDDEDFLFRKGSKHDS